MFRCAQHDILLPSVILSVSEPTLAACAETACRLCHARRRETGVAQLRICFTASSLRGLLSPWQSEQNHTVSPPFPAEHRNALRCHLRRPASKMRPVPAAADEYASYSAHPQSPPRRPRAAAVVLWTQAGRRAELLFFLCFPLDKRFFRLYLCFVLQQVRFCVSSFARLIL